MKINNLVLNPLFLATILLTVACSSSSSQTIVNSFNNAFNKRDFKTLQETMSPDLLVINFKGDTVSRNRTDYTQIGIDYAIPFGTHWKIIEMEQKGNKIFTLEADSSALNQYLYGEPLEFRYEYTISNNQISELKYYSLPGFAEQKELANSKYHSLFTWIATNHPEKFNSAQEPTKKGAIELNLLLSQYLEGKK